MTFTSIPLPREDMHQNVRLYFYSVKSKHHYESLRDSCKIFEICCIPSEAHDCKREERH